MYYYSKNGDQNIQTSKDKQDELLILLTEFQKIQKKLDETNSLSLVEKIALDNRSKEIKEIFFNDHIKLIKYFCLKFKGNMEFEDALQEGILALFKAMKNYDLSSNVKFHTYLGHAIKRNIFKVNIESNKLNNFKYKKAKLIEKLNKQGIQPTNSQIAFGLNLTEEEYDRLDKATKEMSIYKIIDKHGRTIQDMIQDDSVNLIKNYEEEEIRNIIKYAMKWCLKDTYYECVYLHYFCNKTLREIAEFKGVSHQSIASILRRANKKIKECLVAITKTNKIEL